MRKSVIGIVDPVLLNVHVKSYALSPYTRSAHDVQQHEQGQCPGPLGHADGVAAAILWPLARSLARWTARRAFDPRHAAARVHKPRTIRQPSHDTQRSMSER